MPGTVEEFRGSAPWLVRTLAAATLAGGFAAAGAQEIDTLADLRAHGAAVLSAAQVRELLIGNRVVTPGGRAWTYDPDGSLSLVVEQRTGLASRSGSGTWQVDEAGNSCVQLAWQAGPTTTTDRWCGKIYVVDGVHYSVIEHPARGDGAKAHRLEVRRRDR